MKIYIYPILILAVCLACSKTEPTPTTDPQLQKEVDAIDKFLKANVTDYVAYSSLGVRVVVHKAGEDIPPSSGQTVKFTYIGRVFNDSTLFAGSTVSTLLDNVNVKGLTSWLPSLMGGSITTVIVPSKYAYGDIQNSIIPPNATVMFQVTFTGITKTAAQQTQFNKDTIAISSYIKSNAVANVVKHPSGISYTLNTKGNGVYPSSYDNINFHYKAIFMTDGTLLEENDLNSTNIFNLIDGLKIGLPKVDEGGSATFYIPSTLAYGPSSSNSGNIPNNSNLIFEVSLKSIAK